MKSPIINAAARAIISEFLPSFSGDGKTVVFTRRIRDNEDLYISYKADTNWTFPQSIKELNTVFNEGAPAISPDGNTLIFSFDNKEGKGDVFVGPKMDNQILKPFHQSYTWFFVTNLFRKFLQLV